MRSIKEGDAAKDPDRIDRWPAVVAAPAKGGKPKPSRWSLQHPTIVAAIIAAIGAVTAALVSSPLLLNWFTDRPGSSPPTLGDAWSSNRPSTPPVSAKEVMTAREIAEANKEAVVFLQITGTDSNGVAKEATATGFLVSNTGHVITAKHIVNDDQRGALFDQYQITGAVGSPYEPLRAMEVRARDPDADVMLLKFQGSRMDYKTVDMCTTGVSVDVGADLVTLGFPINSDLSVTRGVLSNKDGPGGLWQTDDVFNRGFSGAPVFTVEGRLVGVVRGIKFDHVTGVASYGVVTPIDEASYVLSKLPESVKQCE
jgi:S1-C subfamily serine protease